jgi:hypothetical protein
MALDVTKVMVSVAKKTGKKFTYQGKDYPLDKLFALDGVMPILARKASSLNEFLFNKSFEVNYSDAPDSLTGELLKISDKENMFMFVMIVYDVLEELIWLSL